MQDHNLVVIHKPDRLSDSSLLVERLSTIFYFGASTWFAEGDTHVLLVIAVV